MEFLPTTAIAKMSDMKAPIKVVQGSTYAGKTYGIIPILISILSHDDYANAKATVVCETYPGVREVAKDIFQEFMQAHGRWEQSRWRGSPMEYTFWNGARLQFKSFDNVGKAKAAGKRQILFLNEANHIKFEIADILMTRSEEVWIDFNPNAKFWVHKEVLPQPNSEFLKITYKDNEACPEEVLNTLMIKRAKAFYNVHAEDLFAAENIISEYWANWWKVYGLGEIGSLDGQIFTHVQHVDFFPKGRAVYGIDWGYSNDPTVVVKLKKYRGELYRKQIFYKTLFDEDKKGGMDDLIDTLYLHGVLPSEAIICDNDQVAIDRLRKAGFYVFAAHKPAGSIVSGIQALQDIPLNTHSDSRDLIKEEDLYFWEMKDGKPTGKAVDANNHGWDATRYGYDYLLNPLKKHYKNQHKTRTGGRRRVLYAGK